MAKLFWLEAVLPLGIIGGLICVMGNAPYYIHKAAHDRMAKLFWLEAVLPLGIIGGLICVMGNAPYYIHKAAHDRPKHIGNDVWDVAMERRDKKIMEQCSNAGN